MKETIRMVHDFLHARNSGNYPLSELNALIDFQEFAKKYKARPTYKVGLMLISINSNYWQYAGQVVEDIQRYFLPGHDVDIHLWSDAPIWKMEDIERRLEKLRNAEEKAKQQGLEGQEKIDAFFALISCYLEALYLGASVEESQVVNGLKNLGLPSTFLGEAKTAGRNINIENITEETPTIVANTTHELLLKRKNLLETCKIHEVEAIEWPFGTLMRYSMFLQQEKELEKYDYLFYLDIDMRIVNVVGDEILGEGLTMAEHPMYAVRQEYVPPYEPNKESAAYIPRLAQLLIENGKPRLKPLYAAGGFQGGKTSHFIPAIKKMKEGIDYDLNRNYISIWNDEGHWNKYLFDFKGALTVLSPSYIYPDSLTEEYYKKIWGRDFPPKIVTLTKSFTLQKMDASRFKNF